MQNDSEDNKHADSIEFFQDAYIWPETDQNKEVKTLRKQRDDKLRQEREEMNKLRYQQEHEKLQQHLEEQKQAERERLIRIEAERKRREEDEQRSKLVFATETAIW